MLWPDNASPGTACPLMPHTVQGGLGVAEGTSRLDEEQRQVQITTFESNCDEPTKGDMKEDLGKAPQEAGHSSARRAPGQKHRVGKFRGECRDGEEPSWAVICRVLEERAR